MATLGAGFLILKIYLFAAWVISGDATPTPTGSTPVPGWMKFAIHTGEVVGFIATAALVYFFLIRPWRRDGRISLDGLFVLVFFSLWWQDPILNYRIYWFTYNSEFINFGNWSRHIPGWMSERGYLQPQPLFLLMSYVFIFYALVAVGVYLMQKAKVRWSGMSNFTLIGVTLAAYFMFDLLVEPLIVLLGYEAFPGAIDWLSFGSGRHQFPIYEPLFIGTWLTGFACLRYFRDDRGRTLAERGIDQLRMGRKRKTFVRFLAIMAACELSYLLMYNLPNNIISEFGTAWPQDVVERSYLTNGVCGPDTQFPCR